MERARERGRREGGSRMDMGQTYYSLVGALCPTDMWGLRVLLLRFFLVYYLWTCKIKSFSTVTRSTKSNFNSLFL